MANDIKQFLEAMKMPASALETMPSDAWFMSRSFPPGKVKMAFKCPEPPVDYKDWTVITLTTENFLKLSKILPDLVKDMTKKE